MTVSGRYKLEALLRQREAAKHGRQEQLAGAQSTERDALELEAAARGALEEARVALDRLRSNDGGPLTAAKLMSCQQYLDRRQSEIEDLARALRRAAQATCEARTKSSEAKELLAFAQAELEAIKRDKQRWQQRQRLAKQRLEEAEIDDVVAAQHNHDRQKK